MFFCDVCDAAFTLKQNVQAHLFIYHMQKDGSLKQHTRLMYKCDICQKKTIELAATVAQKVSIRLIADDRCRRFPLGGPADIIRAFSYSHIKIRVVPKCESKASQGDSGVSLFRRANHHVYQSASETPRSGVVNGFTSTVTTEFGPSSNSQRAALFPPLLTDCLSSAD
ncbi:hypothetical protein KIN20_016975 [Parelaphostrongylus tenuis]|uniref:C2H2-type domain-containing protein n=1 Tax=Parelaphostrongylus tenuis TaxID=148309 RepID=A0AAD5N1Z8_PARTN|nr:hypothetical protein KIN20_016975 [Parelaphostrongylus tenuis]